jgi:uncharacterized protein YndB with AHSA1/START domain
MRMHRGLVVLLSVLWMGGAQAQDVGPIVSEAVIEAPPSEVWAVWSTGAGLRTWLAPHAEIDLRIGGLMRTNYNPQGTLGDPSTIENVVLSFEPDRMLSIRVARTPEGFPFATAIQEMWTVIYLDPVDSGRTRIRVVGLGFNSAEESQRMRAFFQSGNDATVRQLQDRFTAVRID